MTYTFCPADPVWYATDLRLDGRRDMLHWTGGRGQDALLVRTPYGVDPAGLKDALCAALSRTDLREGRFTELAGNGGGYGGGGYGGGGYGPEYAPNGGYGGERYASGGGTAENNPVPGDLPPGTAARLVTALERAKHNGCPPDGEARTYTVFACRTAADGKTRFLYGHQTGEISSPRCDIPLRLRIDVEAVARRGLSALLGRRDTGYYCISFPSPCPEGCQDGDLEYRVDAFAVPVTRRMMEAGSVYVRTDLRPRVVSRTAGVVLEGG